MLVAKQAASVAVLTGNRFLFGVGTSPWPEDYALLDVPWERRGKRMDESIEVIRGLTAGGFFEYHGEVFDVPSVKMSPAPAKPVPILIGGHGEAALRRAAVMGDGWMHGGGDPADLPGLLDRLAELRAEAGREDAPFETHVISMDAFTGRRGPSPRGARCHRRDRRVPLALRGGTRHRAAPGQDR